MIRDGTPPLVSTTFPLRTVYFFALQSACVFLFSSIETLCSLVCDHELRFEGKRSYKITRDHHQPQLRLLTAESVCAVLYSLAVVRRVETGGGFATTTITGSSSLPYQVLGTCCLLAAELLSADSNQPHTAYGTCYVFIKS